MAEDDERWAEVGSRDSLSEEPTSCEPEGLQESCTSWDAVDADGEFDGNRTPSLGRMMAIPRNGVARLKAGVEAAMKTSPTGLGGPEAAGEMMGAGAERKNIVLDYVAAAIQRGVYRKASRAWRTMTSVTLGLLPPLVAGEVSRGVRDEARRTSRGFPCRRSMEAREKKAKWGAPLEAFRGK